MTEAQKAAYIFAQCVAGIAEIQGMKVANEERKSRGESPAYGEQQFFDVIDKYGLSHSNVVTFFQ